MISYRQANRLIHLSEDLKMTKLTLVVMDPYEAFEMYSNIEGVKEEHKNNTTFQQALNGDINAMSVFLDNDAEDIRSLTEEEILLFTNCS